MNATPSPTGSTGQPLSIAAAALDAADCAERVALAVHDKARARLREARHVYRREAHATIIKPESIALPLDDADAEAIIVAAAGKLADARDFYDGLVALGESDVSVIDAAVLVEQARLNYEALKNAYAERREESL